MTDYYIDPANGSNSNSGTSVSDAWADFDPINNPWEDTSDTALTPGDTVSVRDTAPITATNLDLYHVGDRNDTPITITNYQDDAPVIDAGPNGHTFGVRLNGAQNVGFSGFEVKNAGRHGVYIRDSDGYGTSWVRVENVESHHNGQGGGDGSGFTTEDAGVTEAKFINCVSHQNQAGGNSDGFQLANGSSGVTCRDCLSWHDQDDGWDTNYSGGGHTLVRCIAAFPGTEVDGNTEGDWNGNGFKFQNGEGGHRLERCVAYGCKRWSVKDYQTANANEYYHMTTWDGDNSGYFSRGTGSEFANCIAYQNTESTDFDGAQNDHHNTWNIGISDPQFADTATDDMDRPQNEDFLKLTQDSPVVGTGTDVGVSYSGSNPDLGAYEYVQSSGSMKFYDGSSWKSVDAISAYGYAQSSGSMKFYDGSSWKSVDTSVAFKST